MPGNVVGSPYRSWSQYDPILTSRQKKELLAVRSSRECWAWLDRLPLDARTFINYAKDGQDLIERMNAMARQHSDIWQQVAREATSGEGR